MPRASSRFSTPMRERLAAAFWPGPLTLVLPRSARLPGLGPCDRRARHHRDSRAGSCGCARNPARLRRPVVAPSANLSGHVSPTRPRMCLKILTGSIDLIVDGGPAPVGVESTIVACLDAARAAAAGRAFARRRSRRALGRDLAQAVEIDRRNPARAGHAGIALCAAHAAPPECHAASKPGEALLAFGAPLPGAAVDR